MRLPWQVDGGNFERLQGNSADFVRLVNALLSAQGRAGKLPDAAVQLNQQDTVADGGVDALVSQAISAGLDPTGWFDVPTCWQFKAQPTSNIKPKEGGGDQEAVLRAEIRKPFSADLVRKGHGYRLCIADDMPANRKTEWEGWLDDEAKKIHPDAKPAKVLTASDLASWVNRYPAVVLRLRPSGAGMKPMAAWQDEVRALTREFVPPNLEKALTFLDDKLLPATSNAVERGNRRVRKMQKTVYRVRTQESLEGRLVLGLQRDQQASGRQSTAKGLHNARSARK